jgi:hypothetical protein
MRRRLTLVVVGVGERGNEWLIVHEHFSMPFPEQLPAKK